MAGSGMGVDHECGVRLLVMVGLLSPEGKKCLVNVVLVIGRGRMSWRCARLISAFYAQREY